MTDREALSRTERLLGRPAMERLAAARVAVFGIGGVGGYAVEALARSGVGALDLVDADVVVASNLNRQIIATRSTLGMSKVEAAAKRIADVAPDCAVRTYQTFFLPGTAGEFDFSAYDYVIDAVDTVTAKIELILRAKAAGVPIICAMGAGNKLDPTRFRVLDIEKTGTDPLARAVRGKLRKLGVRGVKVVCSDEPPLRPIPAGEEEIAPGKNAAPASCAFVPSVVGLIMAGEVIRDLAGIGKGQT